MSTQIIIPTYYAGNLVMNCLNGVFKNIANPDVRVYQNDIGFVKACNKMIKESDDDILILNDDTVPLTDLVKYMSDLAYSKPEIGIVGGKSLSPNGEVINYGIELYVDGNTAHRYYGWRDEDVDFPLYQKAVEGSCMFIKRELIDKLSEETGTFFDEGYGMGYREELDVALRAREAGYKIISSPDAKYIHYQSVTNSKLGITNSTFDYFMSKWSTKLKLGVV